jgi:glycosyltransferase involved in cell wall biosynthesis
MALSSQLGLCSIARFEGFLVRVAYVGPFGCSSSQANTLRVSGLARSLDLLHVEVLIGSAERKAPITYDNSLFPGMAVTCLDEFARDDWPKWRRVFRGFDMGAQTARWIAELRPAPDVVILYGTPYGYLRRLLPQLKKQGIPLVLDVVEWYERSHMPGGKYGPFALANEHSMRSLAKRADGIIVISRFLDEYFSSFKMPVMRVPPLFATPDQLRPKQNRAQDGRTHFVYAGSPGAKDEIGLVLQAFFAASKNGIQSFLHLVGLSPEFVRSALSLHASPDDVVRFGASYKAYGRVENAVSRLIVSKCDFSILLRPDLRYSRAGFPSKVGESLSLGTPMMANLSSNLDEVLVDGGNALVVQHLSSEAVLKQIKRAAEFGDAEICSMKQAALETGADYFSMEKHGERLAAFLRSVM